MSDDRQDSFPFIVLRVVIGTVGVGLFINLVSNIISLAPWLSILLLASMVAAWLGIEWISHRDRKAARPRAGAMAKPPPERFVDPGGLLAQVRSLLTPGSSQSPTVALWGMSGIGKTTLAAQVAYDQDAFPGDPFWADLRVEKEAAPVLRTWLVQCGVTPKGSVPELVALIRQAFHDRAVGRGRILVILDDVSRSSIEAALSLRGVRTPGVSVLVTTQDRQIARDFGDHSLPVPLLPDAKARKLFTGISPGPVDNTADRILELVHGHPLAVTIAAKQVALALDRSAAISQLAHDLAAGRGSALPGTDTVPGLTSVVQIAYNRQKRPAKHVFLAACALAEGAFTAADVAMLLRANIIVRKKPAASQYWAPIPNSSLKECKDHLDMLAQLSMVNWENGRYVVHPVLRSFAREQRGSRQFRAPFRELFAAYAGLYSGVTQEALEALDEQRHNLVSATVQAHEDGRWRQVVRLTHALYSPTYPYLEARGLLREARQVLDLGADATRHSDDDTSIGEFSGNLGTVQENIGDLDGALAAYRTVADLYRRIGRSDQVAVALVREAGVLNRQGHRDEAVRQYRAALEADPASERSLSEVMAGLPAAETRRHVSGREPQDAGWRASAHEGLGLILEARGDLTDARRELAAAAVCAAADGRYGQEISSLAHLTRVALASGERSFAGELYDYAQREFAHLVYPDDRSQGALSVALIADSLGRRDEAEQWYRRALAEVAGVNGQQRKSAAAALALFLVQKDLPVNRDEAERLAIEARDTREVTPSHDAIDNARSALLMILGSRGDWDGAAQELERAADACRITGARMELLDLLSNLIEVERHRARYQSGARLADQCLEIARELGDEATLAIALRNKAGCAANMTDLPTTERTLAELPAELPDSLEFQVDWVRAVLAIYRGNMAEAGDTAGTLRETAEANGPPDVRNAAQYAVAWQVSEAVARLTGDRAATMDYLDRWRALDMNGTGEPLECLVSSARLALDHGDVATARDICDRLRARSDMDAETRLILRDLDIRGALVAGPWDGLAEALEDQFPLVEATGRTGWPIEVRLSLGALNVATRDVDGALRHLSWCRDRAENLGLTAQVMEACLVQARACRQAGNLPRGRSHAAWLLRAVRRHPCLPYGVLVAHIELARQAIREERAPLAEGHLNSGRRLLAASPNDWHLASLLEAEGELALLQGNSAAAQACHLDSLGIRRRLGLIPEQADSLLHLATTARSQGDKRSASYYYQQAMYQQKLLGAPARRWQLDTSAELAGLSGAT